MKLQINFKNQLQNWRNFFELTIFFIVVGLYLYYKNGSNGLFVFFIFLGIQFFPTAYLHIVYFFENKGEEYSIESDKIIRFKNAQKEVFNSIDIKKIVICKSASQEGWGIPYTTFETFRLAKIYLNDGRTFIMTNLLEFDIEKPLKQLKGVKFERRKGFSFFI